MGVRSGMEAAVMGWHDVMMCTLQSGSERFMLFFPIKQLCGIMTGMLKAIF